MSEERENPGFTVVDKRGGRGETAEEAAPAEPQPTSRTAEGEPPRADLPKPEFGTFLLSLGTSAFYHMGLVQDPETGQPAEPNLPVARQTIDTLELLQEKTRGNLDDDESKLLQNLLTELRMRFIDASK
jgi:hypothetical protein